MKKDCLEKSKEISDIGYKLRIFHNEDKMSYTEDFVGFSDRMTGESPVTKGEKSERPSQKAPVSQKLR